MIKNNILESKMNSNLNETTAEFITTVALSEPFFETIEVDIDSQETHKYPKQKEPVKFRPVRLEDFDIIVESY